MKQQRNSRFRNGAERHANRFATSASRSNIRYSLSDTHATPDGYQDKLSRAAQKDNQHMAALYALTIAIATSEAAKVIEEQSKEIDTLKTQSTVAAMNPSSIGRCIYILGSAMMLQYTIIAELHGKYLITPYHTKESELLTNLRLIERSQAVFIDDAQRAVFNA